MRDTPRRLSRSLLPQSLIKRYERWRLRASGVAPHKIDLSRARIIRDAPLTQLQDQQSLEDDLLPRLGLNPEHFEQFPSALEDYSGGLCHWQYPSQFSRYLTLIARYPVSSYVEIGTRHGGTFVITCEYLRRFRPLGWALGADYHRAPSLERYAAEYPEVEVYTGDSQAGPFRALMRARDPDLALIDGDHGEEGCWSDTMLMLPRSKIIVLHDIVSGATPGVVACWERLKAEHRSDWDFHEFTQQYDDVLERLGHPVLGIGVAVRKDFVPV